MEWNKTEVGTKNELKQKVRRKNILSLIQRVRESCSAFVLLGVKHRILLVIGVHFNDPLRTEKALVIKYGGRFDVEAGKCECFLHVRCCWAFCLKDGLLQMSCKIEQSVMYLRYLLLEFRSLRSSGWKRYRSFILNL